MFGCVQHVINKQQLALVQKKVVFVRAPEIDDLNSTSYEDCLQLKDVLSVRDGEERKKEDMGRAGGNTVLSLKRVDTKKHDYLEKTGSALTVLMGWMMSVFS